MAGFSPRTGRAPGFVAAAIPRGGADVEGLRPERDLHAGLEFATAGDGIPGLDGHVIDHVVHSPHLRCVERAGWPGRTADGKPMSDHTGVRVDLVASGA